MKIDRMDTVKLRNDAHFQFNTEFSDLVNKTGAETLKIKFLFDKYVPLFHKEDDSFKKIIKSAYTKRIHDADKARDETWYGMLEVNNGYLRHFDPAVKESARVLKIVFDTYGKVAQKPLNEQTSALHNILQDLTGKYSADVSRVGLVPWVTELQNRNSEFDNLMKERFDETAAKCDVVLRDARAEVDEVYNAIVNCINAFIIGEGAENYEVFVRTLNAIIAKYKPHSHRHHGAGNGGTNTPPQTDSSTNAENEQDDTTSDPQQGDEA